MKVLITVKKKGWSGETAILLDLAIGLRELGHETVLAAKDMSATAARAREKGLEVFPVVFETNLSRLPSQIRDHRRLGRFIRERSIDLVHAHASWDHWLGGFTARHGSRRVPLVRTKHNLKGIRTHLMNRWLYRGLTTALVAPSRAVEDHLKASPVVDASRVHRIPNGIRADVFDPKRHDGAPVRKRLDVAPHEILVTFCSRLSKRKNPECFIDAARKLKDSDRPLVFVVAGAGDGVYAARLAVRAEGIDRFVFTGHWDDVPGLLAATDIFVLPSHTEPFGLAPLEAMAMGKAAVVSPAEGFRDFLESEVNGIRLATNDAEALAEAVARLADDASLRKRLGAAGRKTVLAEFTSEVMVRRTAEFYGTLLEGRRENPSHPKP